MSQRGLQDQFLMAFPELFPRLKFRGIKKVREGVLGPFGFLLRLSPGDTEVMVDLECITLNAPDVEELLRLIHDIETTDHAAGDQLFPTIIAPALAPEAQALCADHQIGYLLLDGNALLQTPQLYYSIRTVAPVGRPAEAEATAETEPAADILVGKAERLARTLLIEPERRWTMREVADAAGISLGLASTASSRFAQAGWVHKGRSGLTLRDGQALLVALSEAYDLMRNAYRMYRTPETPSELLARLTAQDGQMPELVATLWTAASAYLEDLSSQGMIALYAEQTPDMTARQLGLGQEGQTMVFVFQPYDSLVLEGRQTQAGLAVVGPLQLYLDLMCGDENERELAQRVREELFFR